MCSGQQTGTCSNGYKRRSGFESLDGEPVTLLFLIAAPDTKDNVHLDVLSKLSMMLMDEEFTKNLRNASTAEEFLEIIDKADEERKVWTKDFRILIKQTIAG